MRHFDFQGPILQTRPAEAAPQAAAPVARDYLLLEDLVGEIIEFRLADRCRDTTYDAAGAVRH